jgi:hypothetical protein
VVGDVRQERLSIAATPEIYSGAAQNLPGAGLAACFVPARRAAPVDPAVALRCEKTRRKSAPHWTVNNRATRGNPPASPTSNRILATLGGLQPQYCFT